MQDYTVFREVFYVDSMRRMPDNKLLPLYGVELVPAATITANNADAAIRIAKRKGFSAPIVGVKNVLS